MTRERGPSSRSSRPSRIAVASPRPKSLRMASGLNRNDAKTVIMIAAAAVITRAVVARPSATATALSPVRRYSSRMREIRNTS